MIFFSNNSKMDQEFVSKSLSIKEHLSSIRNVVVWARSILIWRKSYHAPLIGSLVSFIFLLIWLMDQNVLPKLCIIGIVMTIVDYILPKVDIYIASEIWSDKQEQAFESSCEAIARVCVAIEQSYTMFFKLKKTNTKLYYSAILVFLLLLFWIGNTINNLFLTYLSVLLIFYYPGLSHHNMLDKVAPFIYNTFTSSLQAVTSPSSSSSSSKQVKKQK